MHRVTRILALFFSVVLTIWVAMIPAVAASAQTTSSPSTALGSSPTAANAAMVKAPRTAPQWHWANQGGQITTATSTVTYGGNLYVFTRGQDGHLWVNYWDGAWHWADQGGQITTAISTVTYGGNLYVFTRGWDGHLWVNYWSP